MTIVDVNSQLLQIVSPNFSNNSGCKSVTLDVYSERFSGFVAVQT